MRRRVKVTGYIDLDDDEVDEGPLGPLTEEAHLRLVLQLGLDDVEFEWAES